MPALVCFSRDRFWSGAFGAALVAAVAVVLVSGAGGPGASDVAVDVNEPTGPPSAAVVEEVLDSALLVEVVACGVNGKGTGVAFSGGVVTNAHVVAGSSEVRLVSADGDSYEATVVAFDPLQDLALLDAPGMAASPLELAAPAGGDSAVILARGVDDAGEPRIDVVSAEIERTISITISDIYGEGRHRRPGMELAAELGPGDSGAGVIDAQGRLVGVVFSTSVRDQGVAYAISSSGLEALVQSRSAGGVDLGPCR